MEQNAFDAEMKKGAAAAAAAAAELKAKEAFARTRALQEKWRTADAMHTVRISDSPSLKYITRITFTSTRKQKVNCIHVQNVTPQIM